MTNKLSPCGYCTRVADPRECENKNCMLWRKWYIDRWDAMRAAVRVHMDVPGQPVGVCVSGTHDAAPHQVTAYLEADPCESCLCPRSLCTTPCRTRISWDRARQEVLL